MASKKNSALQKIHYKTYKDSDRAEKNKKRKLEKHLKLHPNDEQSLERRSAKFPKQQVFATKTDWSRNYLKAFR